MIDVSYSSNNPKIILYQIRMLFLSSKQFLIWYKRTDWKLTPGISKKSYFTIKPFDLEFKPKKFQGLSENDSKLINSFHVIHSKYNLLKLTGNEDKLI